MGALLSWTSRKESFRVIPNDFVGKFCELQVYIYFVLNFFIRIRFSPVIEFAYCARGGRRVGFRIPNVI